MKISFHSYANKTNFYIKRFALSLAFIVKFTAIRKWAIVLSVDEFCLTREQVGGLVVFQIPRK